MCQDPVYPYGRKPLQYFTRDYADNDWFFLFFFSSIYGYSIKQLPEDGEPATVSKRSISVFAVHHMFEV